MTRPAARPAGGEPRLAVAIDDAPIGLARLSLEGQILESNAALRTLLGLSDDASAGFPLLPHLILAEDARGLRDAFSTLGSGKASYWRQELQLAGLDGHRRNCALSLLRTSVDAGRAAELFAQFEDRIELLHAEARFHHIFWSSPIGTATVALSDDRILDANPALCTLTGYSREALLGLTFRGITTTRTAPPTKQHGGHSSPASATSSSCRSAA